MSLLDGVSTNLDKTFYLYLKEGKLTPKFSAMGAESEDLPEDFVINEGDFIHHEMRRDVPEGYLAPKKIVGRRVTGTNIYKIV